MNLLQRAGSMAWRWLTEESPDAVPDPLDPRWWNGGYQGQNMAGQWVTEQTAMQLDVVQAILERLGGTIGSLPMMVFERLPGGDRRPAREHPLFKILHSTPNSRQPAVEYREDQQRHLASWRNAYAIIRPRDDGHPIGELDPVHPRRVQRVEMGTDGWVYYSIRDLASPHRVSVYRADEIWHIRKPPLTEDGLCGEPVWRTSREVLGNAIAVRQFGALFFRNGGSGGGVIEHPTNFKSTGERDQFMEAWRESGTGLNRHKDRLLLFGLKYSPFTVKNDEAQFIDTRKETALDVCRIWSMPPHMVGILDRATFSNIEQQSIEFVVYTLAPWICAWEQAASRDLLIGEDQDRYFVELNVAGLLRGDWKTRWQSYAWGRQWGWLSANDVRRLEGMEPIGPGGDKYLTPMNMNPAGAAGADGTLINPPDPDKSRDPADRNDDT